jgi:hypothetical protein
MKLSLLFAVGLLVLAATFLLGPVAPLCIAVALATYFLFPVYRSRQVVAVAFVLVLIAPGYAFAAVIDIGQALTGSLQDIINGAVSALIAGLGGWLFVIFKNKWNIDIEAQNRDALIAFLQRQASGLVAQGAVKLSGVKVEVQNEALAAAANAALAAIPGALKFFGLTPEKIKSMIIDMIPKQPAVAQAQAVAIDVANPATPSKPA